MSRDEGPGSPPIKPSEAKSNIVDFKSASKLRTRISTDKDLSHALSSVMDRLKAVHVALGIPHESLASLVNQDVLVRVWDSTFSTGPKGIFMVLNGSGELIGIKPEKLQQHIRNEYFTDIINIPMSTTKYAELSSTDLNKLVSSVTAELSTVINSRRQRVSVNQSVSMFAIESTITMSKSAADVVFKYPSTTPVPSVDKEVVELVMEDFRDHFEIFDQLIEAIIAARFAPDRRNAFMWIQAISGWGKSLLIAALAELGLVVELSVKEIEAALEGKAVGVTPTDFVNAWVLVIDEFKTIKSEVKQLNNTISLSPKYSFRGTAPVYFKLFTSAEDVASLTGSEGVESQFVKRFSYFKPSTGDLEERPVFSSVGSGVYRRALSAGIAAIISIKVAEYRVMGEIEAEKEATKVLNSFNAEHSIGKHFVTLDHSVEEHAADLRELLLAYGNWMGNEILQSNLITTLPQTLQDRFKGNLTLGRVGELDVIFLQRPVDVVKAWLENRVNKGQISKISHKVNDIIAIVNEVGNVSKTTRLKQVTTVTGVTEHTIGKGIAVKMLLESRKTPSESFL